MAEDLAEWSSSRLQERYDELLATAELQHGESRMREVKRELAYVKFELSSRGSRINRRQPGETCDR
jgi:ribosomal protein L29